MISSQSRSVPNPIVRSLEELCNFGEQSLSSVTPDEVLTPHKRTVLALSNSSVSMLKGLAVLISVDLRSEAELLARALLEYCVTIQFISRDPDNRSRLWLDYDILERKQLHDICEKYKNRDEFGWVASIIDTAITDSDPARLTVQYNSVEANYPNKYRWSGRSVKAMAEEVDMQCDYDFAYRLSSWVTHGSAPATSAAGYTPFTEPPDHLPESQRSPLRNTHLKWIALFSGRSFARILTIFLEVFSLIGEDELQNLADGVVDACRGQKQV